jgi:hypothetical protein
LRKEPKDLSLKTQKRRKGTRKLAPKALEVAIRDIKETKGKRGQQ